jgi:hypothetical protein
VELKLVSTLASIDAEQWDRLNPSNNPFVSHAFLAGLEECGCIGPEIGWQPHHQVLKQGEQLLAAAPGYIKQNSHGEFVFDFAWADAHMRHGLPYYPKFLCASPYSPITGPRLLSADPAGKKALLEAQLEEIRRHNWLSGHWNFLSENDDAVMAEHGLLGRNDWQFHWHNRGYADFDSFLADMSSKKRKNIRQERRKVREQGFTFRRIHGDEMDQAFLQRVTELYQRTFLEKGNRPVLNRSFFSHLARHFGPNLIVIAAEYQGEMLAMSLLLQGGERLYGRYWGSDVEANALHFETCYYQGIEYAIDQGLSVFEPGAQGEHKIARGFIPTMTRSRHYIRIEPFRDAIADWLRAEALALSDYRQELLARLPFRQDVIEDLLD